MITYELKMTTTEVKPITVKAIDLQADEDVDSATATHTPPSGDPKTITPTVDSPYINMLFGPFGVAGEHKVIVQAIGDAGSKPTVVYWIDINDSPR